jgi:virulence-associated protein VapD
MHTTYDDIRDEINKHAVEMRQCAVKLFDREIYGYNELPKDYDIKIMLAINNLLEIL